MSYYEILDCRTINNAVSGDGDRVGKAPNLEIAKMQIQSHAESMHRRQVGDMRMNMPGLPTGDAIIRFENLFSLKKSWYRIKTTLGDIMDYD